MLVIKHVATERTDAERFLRDLVNGVAPTKPPGLSIHVEYRPKKRGMDNEAKQVQSVRFVVE